MDSGEKPHFLGHRQRLKDKFASAGLAGWAEHEILEFLLSFAIPRKDTKATAKQLLAKFGSFSGVLDAAPEDIESVKGVSRHSALFLKLIKSTAACYAAGSAAGKDLVTSPERAVGYLKALLKGSKDEQFHALFLDSANALIASENLQTGTVNKSAVYPRKVAERALYHKAVGVIISHNHPGGTLKPSDDDKRSTEAIKEALRTIEAELLDHLIICGNAYFSFKENGLL
jgi:DNA repair protein RadC